MIFFLEPITNPGLFENRMRNRYTLEIDTLVIKFNSLQTNSKCPWCKYQLSKYPQYLGTYKRRETFRINASHVFSESTLIEMTAYLNTVRLLSPSQWKEICYSLHHLTIQFKPLYFSSSLKSHSCSYTWTQGRVKPMTSDISTINRPRLILKKHE